MTKILHFIIFLFPQLFVFMRLKWLLFASADVKQWEYISYCLAQVAFTEKGMKKLIDAFKTYEHVLSEDSVMEHFKSIINKVRNLLSCPCSLMRFRNMSLFILNRVRS